MSANTKRLEVHAHAYINGPNACREGRRNFRHSHADGNYGDGRHKHPDTGPALFDIDADEWAAATGLKGGGRKSFTDAPTGPQLDRVDLEDWQRTFTVVVHPSAKERAGGGSAVARIALAFDMEPIYEVEP
jgi:hypothetical protein